MLAAEQRLRRAEEFSAVVRSGRRAGRGGLVVHLLAPADSGDAPVRAGFVVSKAVGNAVTRNLVRRRLRHLIRDRLAELPAGTEVVVRVLPSAAAEPYARLAADLDAALAAARRGSARSGRGSDPVRARGGASGA